MTRIFLAIGFWLCATVSAGESAKEPVLLYEHDPSLLTTTVQVVVLTGSADDPKGKDGLSNLMGEMILRGTLKRSREQFQNEVERLGASLSVQTSYDITSFYGAVIKENTLPFLNLFEEALFKPGFSKGEFEPLRREVLAEIAHLKNNNMQLAGLALRREALAGTPMETPGMGTTSTVKKVTLEEVIKTYSKEFHRDNLIFAVASPLPLEKLKPRLVQFWNRFPPGTRRARKQFEPTVPKGQRLVVVHKPKTSTGSLMFGQGGITAQDPLRYTLGAANFVFGGEPLVSRLFRIVRSELGWTYAIGSTYNAVGQLTDQKGLYVISSTPSVEFTAKAIFKIRDMWKEFLEEGVEKNELSLAQDSLVNSYPFEFDEARKRLWNLLRSHLYRVPILSPEAYEKEIRGITNQAVRKALAERQAGQGWVISLVADKAVIEKQLVEEQKDVPADKRLTIAKVYTPDELIQ